ncbi:hypothetical protein MRB53_034274 [Persea americana]|uniref:Uncharacterized protein n=1 Tax=Persea americana TaxID=3435 RepID=A0ACC2KX00_PERAE|nr:hypothetical protein MRB53_034274 [Persea americana]
MSTSLHSSFHGARSIQLGHRLNDPQRHGKIHSISCRATTNSDMGKQTNFYQVLSLRSEYASIEEIKKAYRSMALVYHPDVCPPSRKEEFAQMFILVHKAYHTLSDPILRKKHDRELGLEQVENERKIWEEQLLGLKIRSDCRVRTKEREF